MNQELEDLYKSELDTLRRFMDGKASKSSRNNGWSEKKKISEIERNPICLTCDEKLTLENLTREHIHPLCLGGVENPKNVIPMCKQCNISRNKVMQDSIGFVKSSAIIRRWPGNRLAVESFLIWSNATINGDCITADKFPGLNASFYKHRGINQSNNEQTEDSIDNSFKFQLMSFGKKFFKKLRNNSKPSERISCSCGKTVKIDFSKKKEGNEGFFRCPECKSRLTGILIAEGSITDKKINKISKPISENKAAAEPENVGQQIRFEVEEFPILDKVNGRTGLTLPREPIVMLKSVFWLKSNDLQYENWKELTDDFKKQSITTPRKHIRTLIHLTCWFTKDEFSQDIFSDLRKKLREITVLDLLDIIEQECKVHHSITESDFDNLSEYFRELRKINNISIKNFNTSSGLRLPATPQDLGRSIIWLRQEVRKSEKFNDLKDRFDECGILPKSRTRNTLSFILRSFEKEGEVKQPINELLNEIREDLAEINISDLCQMMYNKSQNYAKLGFVECSINNINYYFFMTSLFK